MKNKYVLILLGILISVVISIRLANTIKKQPSQTNTNSKIKVVASFYPLYFFASEIGGDKAIVSNLTPAGAEPHDFEPSAQDMAEIEKSDLLILHGGIFESWGKKLSFKSRTKPIIIKAGENITLKSTSDPHVWLDPILAKQEAEIIEKGFEQADPVHAQYYKARLAVLLDLLTSLDSDFKKGLSHCGLKDFVTSHSAFGFLADRYGLNQIAIAGISPDMEPTSKKLAQITNVVRQKKIQVIFFESLVGPKLSQTIADELDITSLVLDPLEGITSDKIKEGNTYFTVMQENLMNLRRALQCV